ncbi:MAG: type II secretory pathway predicted ATPase ExeA [Bermanella sp.]|jgi:type II secretory pathway predicted ATPase ExeA
MYLGYYGFNKNPFQMTPDNDNLYMSLQHSRALVYMDYATRTGGGFVVITGEIGSGKTTLVKCILKNMRGKINFFHFAFANLTGNDLFHYLLRQVNIIPKKEDKISLIYTFKEYLIKQAKSGVPYVLIIDEAQNLTLDQLEDIRMLSAIELNDEPLLRITLLGQPEFLETINASEQFKQRVKLHYHLKGLEKDDVEKYIEFRLVKSGLKSNVLFDKPLIEKIYKYSRGIPRLINKICDALLMCAFADGKEKPNLADVETILRDLMIDNPTSIAPKKQYGLSNTPEKLDMTASNVLMERLVCAVENLNNNLSLLVKKDR